MDEQPLREAPPQLKAVQAYMRVAADIDRVNPVVGYWVRLFSTELALKIDRSSPECKSFLADIIVWLEKFKESHKTNEAVTQETVGQAHMENFVISLFEKADNLDRAGTANKTTVRMFYMAALLFEAMEVFGPLTEEITQKAKYAKFKAAYIQKCLRTGETPVPGPVVEGDHEQAPAQPPAQAPAHSPAKPQPPSSETKKGLDIPEVPSNHPDSDKGHFWTSDSLPVGGSSAKMSTTDDHKGTSPNSHSLNASISSTKFVATNGADLKPEDITQAQKHCKFVISALQYDDISTAVDYLQKALTLLTTGQQ